jgi:hypothetical protein
MSPLDDIDIDRYIVCEKAVVVIHDVIDRGIESEGCGIVGSTVPIDYINDHDLIPDVGGDDRSKSISSACILAWRPKIHPLLILAGDASIFIAAHAATG